MPKISIITPCYNCESFIGKTIESLQSQTYTDWEHIIVDDGSSDRSKEVVQVFIHASPKFKLISQSNSGVAKARNVGYKNISGDSEYILFLDSDDFLKPEMLLAMVNYMDLHPDLGFASCDRIYTDKDGAIIETPRFLRYLPTSFGIHEVSLDQPEISFLEIFNLAPILPSTCVIRRSVYSQTEGWDETFGQPYEDTNLFLNLSLQARVHYLNCPLVYYRRHDQQSVSDNEKFYIQEKKLYHSWTTRQDLTLMQHQIISEAWEFRNGRLAACLGFQSGNLFLKQGQISKAIRFYGGALRRYISSFG